MSKRFIITESDRDHIRKMYGLIKEGREQVQEVEAYSLEYINKDGCDGIATDIRNLSDAVNRGEVNLSSSGRSKLEENKKDVGKINGFTCGIAKNQMRNALNRELSDESQYPDAILTACWMSKNSVRHRKTLSICNQTQTPTPTQQPTNDLSTNNQSGSVSNVPTQNTQTSNNYDDYNLILSKPEKENVITIGGSTDDSSDTNNNTNNNTNNTNNNTNNTNNNTQTSDYQLDTVDKIKNFQTWLDNNYGKWAWSTRYNRSYKVNKTPSLGWGKMGPNTTKKWADPEIRGKYLDYLGTE